MSDNIPKCWDYSQNKKPKKLTTTTITPQFKKRPSRHKGFVKEYPKHQSD